MRQIVYHVTEKTNKSSIMKDGLLRKDHAFICLCENTVNWISMFTNPCVFSVNIEKFMKDNPDIDVRTWLPDSDEICVWGDIPEKYIKEE